MVVDGTPTAVSIAGDTDVETAGAFVPAAAGGTGTGLIHEAGLGTDGRETVGQMIFDAAQEQVGEDLAVGMLLGGRVS